MDTSIKRISTAKSRKSKDWKEKAVTWEKFLELFKTPKVGKETMDEYLALPKDRQDALKDVGGFVGGTLKDGIRKAQNVLSRSLITLDLDNMTESDTADVFQTLDLIGYKALVYSTRKHQSHKPRLRIVFPLETECSKEEYEPIARMLGSRIGIDLCDPTTFEASRLMYFPSICKGADYVYKAFDGEEVNAEKVLGLYHDWKNIAEWPKCQSENLLIRREITKQGNPLEKSGLIGAFCNAYDIPSAIEHFLSGIYLPTDRPDRWTYADGSTTGGAVLYDNDTFMYSHHATDPISGILVNAFDLVRLHKFGDLDEKASANTKEENKPSFKAMCSFVNNDPTARSTLDLERMKAFEMVSTEEGGSEELTKDDLSWMADLKRNEDRRVLPTIRNLETIMQNDFNIKGKIYSDSFTGRNYCGGAVPWDKTGAHEWTDEDDCGLIGYIETAYAVYHKDKCYTALTNVLRNNRINSVADYLNSLSWDGVERAETLFIDYLGAEDNCYTREVTLKTLLACAIRAYKFGAKYDNMLILTGEQGIGKSTILEKLGKDWFADFKARTVGKEAEEAIAGKWIVEMGELAALNKQESEDIKQFLSMKSSYHREAYGRRSIEHKRKCVFFGTSNKDEFLRDETGNRRFYPLPVGVKKHKKNIWKDLTGSEIDQIWAEIAFKVDACLGDYDALQYQVLSEESNKILAELHEEFMEQDPIQSMVEKFAATQVPVKWMDMDIAQRITFLEGNMVYDGELMNLPYLSPQNIHCELLKMPLGSLKRLDSHRYLRCIKVIKGTKKARLRDENYGQVRCYKLLNIDIKGRK